MDLDDLAAIYNNLDLYEGELIENEFHDSVRESGDRRIALSLVGKVLATSQINREAFKWVIDPIWRTLHGFDAEDVGGSSVDCLGNRIHPTMRVNMDITQPLRRVLKVTLDGETFTVLLTYERLPNYCFHCGRLGHIIGTCSSASEGVLLSTNYGVWLLVAPLQDGSRGREKWQKWWVDDFKGRRLGCCCNSYYACHIYGSPNGQLRGFSWDLLRLLCSLSSLLWICAGDFNEIMSEDEKYGGNTRGPGLMSSFREAAAAECGLQDQGFFGPRFTWTNIQPGLANVHERLDKSSFSYLLVRSAILYLQPKLHRSASSSARPICFSFLIWLTKGVLFSRLYICSHAPLVMIKNDSSSSASTCIYICIMESLVFYVAAIILL
ncbi:hypothetical protein Dsin_010136 [Dipteronia sinensis]|uniref:CCHC-type domain-containing protein n=1 Tax=Dipteronia sinensis TaxID=43782 RepID=A0AAE0ARY0_9ROSI|nr:hypothetical protein Dsin_010136 [Dipteronia sinensis]